MSVIVDSKYRGPHDNTERKTFMCDPQHMHRWVIVVSCLSVCVHVCTVKMNDYKQPFFSYLSYIIVTQVTLKWVVFTHSLLQ